MHRFPIFLAKDASERRPIKCPWVGCPSWKWEAHRPMKPGCLDFDEKLVFGNETDYAWIIFDGEIKYWWPNKLLKPAWSLKVKHSLGRILWCIPFCETCICLMRILQMIPADFLSIWYILWSNLVMRQLFTFYINNKVNTLDWLIVIYKTKLDSTLLKKNIIGNTVWKNCGSASVNWYLHIISIYL